MTEPSDVWVVRTELNGDNSYHYAAKRTEAEAKDAVAAITGETPKEAKRVRNVDHLQQDDVRGVPQGIYIGPLIP